MIIDKFSQHVFNEAEVLDILMSTASVKPGPFLITQSTVDVDAANKLVGYNAVINYLESDKSIAEFDSDNQSEWFMPQDYKEMDIAAHVLELCDNQEELQRCGEELLLYQNHRLFDLLRYLKYLVDLMDLHDVIWGVGRGSSVSSFILYKLKVHRINSMYYDLDIHEFLRD